MQLPRALGMKMFWRNLLAQEGERKLIEDEEGSE
jgi:hypothetical protein